MATPEKHLQYLLSYHYESFSLRDILKFGELSQFFKAQSSKVLRLLIDKVEISNFEGKTTILLSNKKGKDLLLSEEWEQLLSSLEGITPRHLSLKNFHCSEIVATALKKINTKKLEILEMGECSCLKLSINLDLPKLRSLSRITASLLLQMDGVQLTEATMEILTINKAKEILRHQNPNLFYHEIEELFHGSLNFSCDNLKLFGGNIDFIKQEELRILVQKLQVKNLSLKPKEWSGFFERDLGFAISTGANIEEPEYWNQEVAERIPLETFELTVKSSTSNSRLPAKLFSWFSVQNRLSVVYEAKKNPKDALEEIVNTCYKLPKIEGKMELDYVLEEINGDDFWDIYGDSGFNIFSRKLMAQLESVLFKARNYKLSPLDQRLQVTAVREKMAVTVNVQI